MKDRLKIVKSKKRVFLFCFSLVSFSKRDENFKDIEKLQDSGEGLRICSAPHLGLLQVGTMIGPLELARKPRRGPKKEQRTMPPM